MGRRSLRSVPSSVMGVMGISSTVSGTATAPYRPAYSIQHTGSMTKVTLHMYVDISCGPTSDGNSGLPEIIS
jgi:hypothetical protein